MYMVFPLLFHLEGRNEFAIMATGSTGIRGKLVFHRFLLIFLLVELSDCQSDVLAQGQELINGSQLISATGIFALGFYSPTDLNTSYLGICHNRDMQKPVWIANRDSPIASSSGFPILSIDGKGSLKITHKGGGGYSFSLYEVEEATNSSAILLDTGNFVLRELNPDGSVKRQLWQSFDYPTDTLLPGMKLGINHKIGYTWSLTSWRGKTSPPSGAFKLAINPNNTDQLVILLRGDIFWTNGNWQPGRFEFSQELSSINNQYFNLWQFPSENETYFNYSTSSYSYYPPTYSLRGVLPQLRLDDEGDLLGSRWDREVSCPFFEGGFSDGVSKPDGGVGKKHHKFPECRNPSEYISTWWEYGYMEGNGSKYKESENLTLYECEKLCISNCDCVAYAGTNEDGTGCEIWSTGAALSSVDEGGRRIGFLHTYEKPKSRVWLWIIVGLIGAATILLLCFILFVKWKTQIVRVIGKIWKKKDSEQRKFLHEMGVSSKSFNILRRRNNQRRDGKRRSELQFFSFESVAAATNNFADGHRLGEGGFGPVYKGSLPDGQEVAIKRPSRNSGQGLERVKKRSYANC